MQRLQRSQGYGAWREWMGILPRERRDVMEGPCAIPERRKKEIVGRLVREVRKEAATYPTRVVGMGDAAPTRGAD